MDKVIAKYQVKVPSILMEGSEVIELDPIRLETSTGKIVLYPPGSKEQKPKSYIEPEHGFYNVEAKVERKGSSLWDADTLWLDIEAEATTPFSEKEIRAKLDRDRHQITSRFLRLLRRKLPETPVPIPTSLQYSASFYWGPQPSGQTLAVALIPGVIRVVSKEAGLTKKKWTELQQEMIAGVDTELWEDFIIDAKVALEEDDLNRATIYAAIACEIFIKEYCQRAAKQAGISQKFWKYLKNRRPRVIDYYNPVLHLVKGHSMEKENEETYNRLDRIFQARNKIMHKGKIPSSWNRDKISQLREDIREVEQIISWVCGL